LLAGLSADEGFTPFACLKVARSPLNPLIGDFESNAA